MPISAAHGRPFAMTPLNLSMVILDTGLYGTHSVVAAALLEALTERGQVFLIGINARQINKKIFPRLCDAESKKREQGRVWVADDQVCAEEFQC